MCDKKVSMNELIIKKQKQREALRQQYLRHMVNPYTKEQVFDPAIQRFVSMEATMEEYFRPSPRTSFWGLLFVVPFAACYYWFYRDITRREAKIAAGEVAYKDRWFKFA